MNVKITYLLYLAAVIELMQEKCDEENVRQGDGGRIEIKVHSLGLKHLHYFFATPLTLL